MKNCNMFNEGTALVTYQLKCLLRDFWYRLILPRFCNYLLALQHACIQQNLDMVGLAPWHPGMRG